MERTRQGSSSFQAFSLKARLLLLAGLAVMFIAIDATGFLVLLLVNGLAVGLGEMAIVLSAQSYWSVLRWLMS
jgi:hypothetical protein